MKIKNIIKTGTAMIMISSVGVLPVFANEAPVTSVVIDTPALMPPETISTPVLVSSQSVTIESLAGERLKAYGIIKDLEDVSVNLSNSYCIDMLTSLILLRSDNYKEVMSAEILSGQKIFILHMFGMMDDDESVYNEKDVSYSDFVSYVMKFLGYKGTDIELFDKAKELGYLICTNENKKNSITVGEAYIILDNILDKDYANGNSVKESLININIENKYVLPQSIKINVSSLDDMKIKLTKALEYCPNSVTVNMSEVKTDNEKKNIYEYLINTHYEWIYDMGNFFDFAEYFDPKLTEMFVPEYNSSYDFSEEIEKIRDDMSGKSEGEIEKAINPFVFNETLKKEDVVELKIDTSGMYEHKYLNLNLKTDWAESNYPTLSYQDSLQNFVNERLQTVRILDDKTKAEVARDMVNEKVSYSVTGEKQLVANGNAQEFTDLSVFVLEGSAISEGYAKIYSWMCDYLGLECTIVAGYDPYNPTVVHYWNQVNIDGKWLNVDLAMENKLNDKTKYFLKDNDSFSENRHIYMDSANGSYFDN